MYMRFVHTCACRVCVCVFSSCLCCHILSGKNIAQIFLLLNKLAKLQFTLHCKMQNARKKVCRLQQQHKYVHMYVCTYKHKCTTMLPLSLALPFVYKEVYFVQLPSCSFVLSSSCRRLRLCRHSTRVSSFFQFSLVSQLE